MTFLALLRRTVSPTYTLGTSPPFVGSLSNHNSISVSSLTLFGMVSMDLWYDLLYPSISFGNTCSHLRVLLRVKNFHIYVFSVRLNLSTMAALNCDFTEKTSITLGYDNCGIEERSDSKP